MLKLKIFAAIACLFVAQQAIGDDGGKLVGTWKLVSFQGEYQDNGEKVDWEGKNPKGYIIFTPERRMMAVIEGEGRKAPQTDQDRAALLRNMLAYTGMYRAYEGKFVTKVDVAWNPGWDGTDQERFFTIEGDRLVITTAWGPSQRAAGRTSRAVLSWDRVK